MILSNSKKNTKKLKLRNDLRLTVSEFLDNRVKDKAIMTKNKGLTYNKKELLQMNFKQDLKLMLVFNFSRDMELLKFLSKETFQIKLDNLKKLSLKMNSDFIKNNDVEHIIQAISNLQTLISFEFCYPWGQTGRNGLNILMNHLASLKLVEINLNLRWNMLGDVELEILGKTFEKLNLKKIDLNLKNNLFSAKALSDFFINISSQKRVEVFSIHLERIENAKGSVSYLCECLKQYSKINTLELSLCNIGFGNDEFVSLINSVSTLKQLETLSLDFSSNNFDQEHLKSLEELSFLPELKSIDLGFSSNLITSKGLKLIYNSLTKFGINLIDLSLDLSRNKFKQNELLRFLSLISNLGNLKLFIIKILFESLINSNDLNYLSKRYQISCESKNSTSLNLNNPYFFIQNKADSVKICI